VGIGRRGRGDAFSDVGGGGERGCAIAFEEAAAVFRLGEEGDVPDPAIVAGELEERAVGLVATGTQVHDEALADGIDDGFCGGGVLMDDGWDFTSFKAEAGAIGDRAAACGDGVGGIVGDGSGPELQVFGEGFGPVDGETRGGVPCGWDGGIP
jgi:hypothetical protein